MARLLFAKGSRGQAIEDIQGGLAFHPPDIDGIYGNRTRDGIGEFQRARGLPDSGQVDEITWSQLLQKPIPALFERCLGLTAAFEGHGFSLALGNFDGAGITWGIIGFTLKHGEIAAIVLAMEASRPDLVRLAFEEHTNELLDVLRSPLSSQMAFADSVSIGPRKVLLAEPWRSGFDVFGKLPQVKAEQLRRAHDGFFVPATVTAARFGLATELGVALAFDVQVQNGGVKPSAAATILNAPTPPNELGLRRLVANAVADASSARFREDVRSRKLAIATGTGIVHGEHFTVADWGLAELPANPAFSMRLRARSRRPRRLRRARRASRHRR